MYLLPTTKCKFTPLGFETSMIFEADPEKWRVNLPRWGLKLARMSCAIFFIACKFTPLGFETRDCLNPLLLVPEV